MALSGFGSTVPNELDERARKAFGPTATTYTPNPLLNPATHRMVGSNYVPDRVASRAHVHSTEPMFLSLTQAEQNRFWGKELFDGAPPAGESPSTKSGKKYFYAGHRRPLPCNSWARLMTDHGENHGAWPRLKTVQSEPAITRYIEHDPHTSGSTMPFDKQRKLRRGRLAKQGAKSLWQGVHQITAARTGGLEAQLKANVQNKMSTDAQQKLGQMQRRKRQGLGERTADNSVAHFTVTGFESMCKW